MAKISDDRLRALYTPIAQTQPISRQLCPSPEELQALARGAGDEEARLALLDHVMTCAPCRNDFDLLWAVERAGRKLTDEETPSQSQSSFKQIGRSRWGWTLSAVAAAGLFAIGLQSYLAPRENFDPSVVRGLIDPVTLIAPAADAVADGRSELRFIWNSVPRSEKYELEVLDSAGRIIYRVTTTDTIAVFTDVDRRIDPSIPHRWWVRASMPSGEQLRSPMRVLRFTTK